VRINIGEGDKNLDLAKKYEVPLGKRVPSLAVLDPDGKLVFSQKQGEFESTARIWPRRPPRVPRKVEANRSQVTQDLLNREALPFTTLSEQFARTLLTKATKTVVI